MTDAGPPEDAPSCTCRTGLHHALGTGDGFTVDYVFEVTECDGTTTCSVGSAPETLSATPCVMAGGGFRVYLDDDGYTQLIFSATPCGGTWTGSYATEGGSAPITATRI